MFVILDSRALARSVNPLPTSEVHKMSPSVSLKTILLHSMMAASVFITTLGILSTQNGSNMCHELHYLDPCNKEVAVAVFSFLSLVVSVLSLILFVVASDDLSEQSEIKQFGTYTVIVAICLSSFIMLVFSVVRIPWTAAMSEGLHESALIWSQSIVCFNFSSLASSCAIDVHVASNLQGLYIGTEIELSNSSITLNATLTLHSSTTWQTELFKDTQRPSDTGTPSDACDVFSFSSTTAPAVPVRILDYQLNSDDRSGHNHFSVDPNLIHDGKFTLNLNVSTPSPSNCKNALRAEDISLSVKHHITVHTKKCGNCAGKNAATVAYELTVVTLFFYLSLVACLVAVVLESVPDNEMDGWLVSSIFFEVLAFSCLMLSVAADRRPEYFPWGSAGMFCGTVLASECRTLAVSAACAFPAVSCAVTAAVLRYFSDVRDSGAMKFSVIFAVGLDIGTTSWDAYQISTSQSTNHLCTFKCHDTDVLPISEWAYAMLISCTVFEILASGLDSGMLFKIASTAT